MFSCEPMPSSLAEAPWRKAESKVVMAANAWIHIFWESFEFMQNSFMTILSPVLYMGQLPLIFSTVIMIWVFIVNHLVGPAYTVVDNVIFLCFNRVNFNIHRPFGTKHDYDF